MKTLITNTEYKRLLEREAELIALENGGVDNWEWYGESMDKIEKPIFDDSKNKIVEKEFQSGERVFYQNNPATFISFISDKLAMINLYAGFDVEIESSNFCTQCMVGGDGYLGAHTCEEAQEVIDTVFEIMDESKGYVTIPVNVADLHEKPIVLINHSKLSTELVVKRKEFADKTLEIKSKIIDLNSEVERLEKQITLKEDYLKSMN